MRTATVTWVNYRNYGTLLQAYALQNKIQQLGHENLILDDKEIIKNIQRNNNDVRKRQETNIIRGKERLFGRVARIVKHPARIRRCVVSRLNPRQYERPYAESQRLLDDFKKEKVNILYDLPVDRLSELNDQFDVFIAGSDQIWTVFEKKFNSYYYLDFVTKRKISYAPSLGTDRIPEENKEKVKQLLSDYSAISVRESCSARQLSEMTGKEVEWVADPTMLQTRSFWCKLTADIPRLKKRYLLCYFLENKAWYFKYAHVLARKFGLKIILIPSKWDYINSEYVTKKGVGPKEFVSFIQHAEYVLTDSYHGAVFSLIFEKQFRYLLRFADDDPYSENIRIRSLFGYLKLNKIIIMEKNAEFGGDQIDYDSINEKIEQLREKSLTFLKESLN